MHSNLPLQEYLLEEYRAEIQRETNETRLLKKTKAVRPGVYAQGMRRLAKWLIARGKALELKYEPCPSASRTYAH